MVSVAFSASSFGKSKVKDWFRIVFVTEVNNLLKLQLKNKSLKVIAQPRGNNDLRGFKAMRMDSKAEKPCLFQYS